MAESFTNSLTSGVGIVTSSQTASIGAGVTVIGGISTAHISVGDMIQTQMFRGGTKVVELGSSQVKVDKTSTNLTAATNQSVVLYCIQSLSTVSIIPN